MLLAAASLLEVDELYAMGGAQAVAALAYGTETIRRVDKIVGPGNSWVTAAKLHVLGLVPSTCLPAREVLRARRPRADPRLVAIDLLCQAEHGPDSPAVLVTTDPGLADRVDAEIERLLDRLDRGTSWRALSDHGMAVIADNHDEAVAFAQEYAGEHVTILTSDPRDGLQGHHLRRIGLCRSLVAGVRRRLCHRCQPRPPHRWLAAAYGPLSVEDFGSWRQVQTLTREGLAGSGPPSQHWPTPRG